MMINNEDLERIKEKLEKMTGERGDATKSLSSVRRGELVKVAEYNVVSKKLTSAPTADDFNNLRQDLMSVIQMLGTLGNKYGSLVIPKV